MKRFVFAFRVEPPPHTVLARSGGSVFDAWYSPFLQQWYLVSGNSLEKIDEPEWLFLDEDWAREHPSKIILGGSKKWTRQSKKEVQMWLL